MNRPPAADFSAILGVEAGVVDLFALFRRKGEARRRNLADPRRTIAPPVTGPMFTNRIEPMNLRRAKPARPAPARPVQARQDQARQEPRKPEPKKPEPTRAETQPQDPIRQEPSREQASRQDQSPRRDGN